MVGSLILQNAAAVGDFLAASIRDLDSANHIDWLPVEYVANLVLDIIAPSQSVYSSITSRDVLAPNVQQYYGDRIKSPKSGKDGENGVGANPGLKLLGTYRGLAQDTDLPPVIFDMRRTNSRSWSDEGDTGLDDGFDGLLELAVELASGLLLTL
ncbi:hypothetical protein HD806DRAFT_526751 [Xylariaceae sp. AK1471]|nr:hypothetical protein HD806DRAFT_526751 [Xylariaceae sp. AK1471]